MAWTIFRNGVGKVPNFETLCYILYFEIIVGRKKYRTEVVVNIYLLLCTSR